MEELFFLNRAWKEIFDKLIEGESVLLHLPRNYGTGIFYKHLLRNTELKAIYSVLPLTVLNDCDTQDLNPYSLKIDVRSFPEIQTRNKFDFTDSLVQFTRNKRVLFIIKANQENLNNAIQLLEVFQEAWQQQPQSFVSQLSILVFDEFAVYYWKNSSEWDYFSRYSFRQLYTTLPLDNFFASLGMEVGQSRQQAAKILALTGGHQGLMMELMMYVQKEGNRQIAMEEFRTHLLNCNVMDSLRRLLYAKDISYIQEVLKYENKRLSEQYDNEAIKELHQLGILLKVDISYSILCTGVISELVKEVYQTKSEARSTGGSNKNSVENGQSQVSEKPERPVSRKGKAFNKDFLKILFVAAYPDDKHRLDVEFDEILSKTIENMQAGDIVLLPPTLETSYEKLLLRLKKDKPNIIHYSGHSTEEGLCLRDENGATQLLRNNELKALFQNRTYMKLIFLNSCYSAVQSEIISKEGIYVLGLKEEIESVTAKEFAKKFYVGFAAQEKPFRIETALNIGCQNFLKSYPCHSHLISLWKDGKEIDFRTLQ